jgi:hypothetical protein
MSHFALERGVPGSDTIGTCCPTNFARTMVRLKGTLYATSDDAIWVHHFGGSRYDDGVQALQQETDYPWNGRIKLTVKQWDSKRSLKLRIPGWVEGATVQLGNSTPRPAPAGTYFDLGRAPRSGESILLDLPMEARLMTANPRIEATRNQLAVMRGPLLYAVESHDLPPGVSIDGVKLSPDASFRPRFDPDLLGGMVVLTGPAMRFAVGDWSGRLYKPVEPTQGTPFELKLIPYFAWANRGTGEMTVWIDAHHGAFTVGPAKND